MLPLLNGQETRRRARVKALESSLGYGSTTHVPVFDSQGSQANVSSFEVGEDNRNSVATTHIRRPSERRTRKSGDVSTLQHIQPYQMEAFISPPPAKRRSLGESSSMKDVGLSTHVSVSSVASSADPSMRRSSLITGVTGTDGTKSQRSSLGANVDMAGVDKMIFPALGYARGEILDVLVSEGIINRAECNQLHRLLAKDDPEAHKAVYDFGMEGATKKSIRKVKGALRSLLPSTSGELDGNSSVAGGRRGSMKRSRATLPNIGIVKVNVLSDDAVEASKTLSIGDMSISSLEGKAYNKLGQAQISNPVAAVGLSFDSVWGKLAARMIRPDGEPCRRQQVLLVASGAFNPIHKLHLRPFRLARLYLEDKFGVEVVGGIVSPQHPTQVRQRFRFRPSEIIPPRHRLAMVKLAVGDSSWMVLDPWELTRRRILDYISVLNRARDLMSERCPQEAATMKILYLCKASQIPTLHPGLLEEGGFGIITVCRPIETERVLKELSGPSFESLRALTYVVEDTAMLSKALDKTSTASVLARMREGQGVEDMVGGPVARYIAQHHIAEKVAGKERWTLEDKTIQFEDCDGEDRPYNNLPKTIVRRESQMPLHH